MQYADVTKRVKEQYNRPYAEHYRRSDELHLTCGSHRHNGAILRTLCCSFDHPIRVLDVGCGTGRYFHCLENVESLTGIDVSPEMLEQARQPVGAAEIHIEHIELICGSIFDAGLPLNSFDLIYAIGVFGEHSPWDLVTCNRLFDLLADGGKLFLTVVDRDSRQTAKSWRRRILERLLPVLPPSTRERLNRRWRCFALTESELRQVMQGSRFQEYEIARHVVESPFWSGAHYECIATRPQAVPAGPAA